MPVSYILYFHYDSGFLSNNMVAALTEIKEADELVEPFRFSHPYTQCIKLTSMHSAMSGDQNRVNPSLSISK
jgi:hypothetical protein